MTPKKNPLEKNKRWWEKDIHDIAYGIRYFTITNSDLIDKIKEIEKASREEGYDKGYDEAMDYIKIIEKKASREEARESILEAIESNDNLVYDKRVAEVCKIIRAL